MSGYEELSSAELVALIQELVQESALLHQANEQLRQANEQLRQEVEMLRSQFRGPGPGNALPPFVKPNRRKGNEGPRQPRRKRKQAYTRKREEPTESVVHALEHCPDCGRKLEGGWEHSRHQVLELPSMAIRIVDHVLIRRRCGVCKKMHVPRLGPDDGVLGQHRVGINLMAYIATLCTDYRLPRESVQRLLQSCHGLHLSEGEICEILHVVAKQGKDAVAAMLAELRRAPFVHADETGWREEGMNGYLWSFSTPTVRYFHRGGRAGREARGVLLGQWEQDDGTVEQEACDPFAGVLVCDFYSGYSWYELLQRCWDHFSRDLKDLRKAHADASGVVAWVKRVFKVYERAKEAAAAGYREHQRRAKRRRLEADLLALTRPYAHDESAPQQALAARIERHLSELFVFVTHPGVPSGNNAAERALRPTVIARKISGGTRSAKGTSTMCALRTLFGTWVLRGRDTLQACVELLRHGGAPARAAPT